MLSVNSVQKLQGFCFLASLSKHDGSSRPVEFFLGSGVGFFQEIMELFGDCSVVST